MLKIVLILLYLFSLEDLRDRHRRRCEKSIGKAKQVKKKACERCIASKVKCGYEKPSCMSARVSVTLMHILVQNWLAKHSSLQAAGVFPAQSPANTGYNLKFGCLQVMHWG